jgi:hypothetical protein
MSTLAISRHSIGHSSIIRRYAVSFSALAVPSLMDRLAELFRDAVTFSDYRDSIEELESRLIEATENLEPTSVANLAASFVPAMEFLMARPLGVLKPDVDVWESGKIAFQWYVSRTRVVDATIDGHRRLVFSALIGQARRGGVEFFDGEWPADIVQAIRDIRA